MIEKLKLEPGIPDYTPDTTDIIAYKKFTRFDHWRACQIRPDIIQTVSKLSQHTIKPKEKC